MAELLWNGLDAVPPATSAGVWARPELEMHPYAATELHRRGVDAGKVAAFRSRPLEPAMVRGAGLILCMEEAHRETVLTSFPSALNKTFTVLRLAELAERFPGSTRREVRRLESRLTAGDVTDPVNFPASEFARTADTLVAALPAISRWVDIDRNR